MRRENWFLITTLLYVLYTIFPLFADLISIPVWLPSIFAISVMMILYPAAFKNKFFYWFCAYAAVLALYVLIGKPLTIGIGTVHDSKKIFIEYAYLLPTVGVLSILYYLKDKSLNRKLVFWAIILLYISFVFEVPLMRQYGSIREALRESDQEINILGLPSYSLMHAYTLMIPAACYAIRVSRERNKIIALFALLVLAFVVYNTFVTTSLLLMVAAMVYLFAYKESSTATRAGVVVLLMFIFFVIYETGGLVSFIRWIMPAFEGTAVEPKLLDMEQSMISGHFEGGTITGRQSLHQQSWDAFWHNPIVGTSGAVGGHSALIDRLGGMGLLAFVPFLMMILSAIKMLSSLFSTKQARTFFMAGIIMGFAFMYTKGLWGSEAWLLYFVLMPYSISVFENKYFSSQ